jgi:hypothetical protein
MTLLKQLLTIRESEKSLPTWEEFDAASDAAVAWYEKLCQDYRDNDEPDEMFPPLRVEYSQEAYWNKKTSEFLIHVVDASPSSVDDGVWTKVSRNCDVELIDSPTKQIDATRFLHDLTSDPETQAHVASKIKQSPWIKFEAGEL